MREHSHALLLLSYVGAIESCHTLANESNDFNDNNLNNYRHLLIVRLNILHYNEMTKRSYQSIFEIVFVFFSELKINKKILLLRFRLRLTGKSSSHWASSHRRICETGLPFAIQIEIIMVMTIVQKRLVLYHRNFDNVFRIKI